MKANEALAKIRVMLGMEAEAEPVSVALAEATLIDGNVVKVEGEFEPGKTLLLVTPDGEVPAPEGIHETDTLLITVDASGVIVSVEEKMVEEAPVVEEEMSNDVVSQIAALIAPLNEKISKLEAQFSALDQDYQKFRGEPAAGKITNNLVNSTDSIKSQTEIKELRMNKLLELRKQK